MAKRMRNGLAILAVIGIFTFIAGEVAIRVIGYVNVDGQFVFRNWSIPPLVIPKEVVREKIEYYLEHTRTAFQIHDPYRGWINQPNYVNDETGITINADGMRADKDYGLIPRDDTLRIAFVGDSFVFGSEVRDSEAFIPMLEQNLRDQGLRVEVLNFGVGGYGLDQIYLDWVHRASAYQPDWVIVGFVRVGGNRTQNIFRPIMIPTANQVFSKPRFILDGEALTLVNSPALSPQEWLDTIDDFETHPIFAYEMRYDERYQAQSWQASKLLATLDFYSKFGSRGPFDPPTHMLEKHVIELSSAILNQFSRDVSDTGSLFSVAYLPMREDVQKLQHGDKPYFWALFDRLERYPVFLGDDVFPEDNPDDWAPTWHYSPHGNRAIANFLTDELMTCIAEELCAFARFESPAEFGFKVD